MLIIDAAIWVFVWLYNGFETINFTSLAIGLLMMGIVPVGLLIWCLFTISNIIEFTNYGIKRIRFGKIIRYFKWEEVETIASTDGGTFTGWFYVSNKTKSYNYQNVSKMRLDKDIIYFHYSPKALQALLTYAPEKFKTQINQCNTN